MREAPILQEWNIRVSTPFAWLIIFLVTAVMTLFAVGCVLLTGDVDWGFAYLAFGVAIAMPSQAKPSQAKPSQAKPRTIV